MTNIIRPANADDQDTIVALVRSERLNPHNLHWTNFVVAHDDGELTGVAQIRCHKDGSRELGSLAVIKDRRGEGLAGQLIDALLARQTGALCMVTSRNYAAHYERWGFLPVTAFAAPARVRRNYLLGQTIGGVHALLTRRRINRLAILMRNAPPETEVDSQTRRSSSTLQRNVCNTSSC